jgi:putative spermidine/putrescine transport system substrate-binding protein
MSKAKQGGFTRRTTLALMGGAAAAPWLGGASLAKPSQLVMATGGGKLEDAYKKVIYAPFQQKHGIAIVTTSNPAAKLKAMVEQKQVEWDVMQGPAEEFVVLAKQGLFEPIDYAGIKKDSLVPGSFHEHFVLTDLAAYHVAWNTKNVKSNPPQSWRDVFAYNGRIGLWKKPFQTLEVALLADGVAKEQLYPLDVERGLKSLAKIKDKLVWWATGAQGAQLILDGEVDVCAIWNGRVHDPKMAGAPVDYHFNQAVLVSDAWAVPKGTKNPKEAMDLLTLAMSPEAQAAFAKTIPYGPTNRDALKLLDDKTKAVLPSPETGIMLSLSYWAENGAKVTERFNQWLLGA